MNEQDWIINLSPITHTRTRQKQQLQLVRSRWESAYNSRMKAGLSPREAVEAVLEEEREVAIAFLAQSRAILDRA